MKKRSANNFRESFFYELIGFDEKQVFRFPAFYLVWELIAKFPPRQPTPKLFWEGEGENCWKIVLFKGFCFPAFSVIWEGAGENCWKMVLES